MAQKLDKHDSQLLLAYEAASANAAAGPKAAAQYALVIAACAAASSEGVTGVPQLPGGGASKAQAKCAADFCGELVQLRCLSKFTALLKSPVLHSKLCGLLLYAALLRYGPAAVRADAVSSVAPDLLDCAKLDAAVAEHLPMTAAARRGLTALADGGKVSEQLLVPLVGFLKAGSPGIAASCCAAISAILTGGPQTASAVAHHLKVLAAADLHTALVALLKKAAGGDASHRAHEAAYMSLLALLARSSADGADRVAALGGVPLVAGVLAASGDEASRLQCCSALGAVARRGGAAAEEVAKAVSVTRMLEVARGVKDPDAAGGAWDDVVAALAALATFHDASRVDLFRSLRAFLLRGNPRDLTLCALLCSSLAPSPKPRELIVVEGMLPGLVAVSRTGVPRARAAAADALTHLAMAPGPVMVTGVDGKQSKVDVARSLLDHKAPQALVEMLSATVAAPPAAASSTLAGPSASSSSSSAAPGAVKAAVLDESLLLEALEGIAAMAAHPGCKEALKACGGSDKVKELVAKGKRRELGERVAKAAADALIKLLY